MDRAHWGQRVLGRAFLRYLFGKKARHPLRPFWWFLITKGYKTYLLMANNFPEHYPACERETPAGVQAVLDAFGQGCFAEAYDASSGLITFPESLGQLKRGVADVTPELLTRPRIAFFQERNATWAEGTELACIARMTWTMPIRYAVKAQIRRWQRRRPRSLGRPATVPALAAARSRD